MGRYIVTGGAGHIGSHVVDALIERGDEGLVGDTLSAGKQKNLNPKSRLLAGSVNVRSASQNPLLASQHGANLTVAALEAARALRIPKFVFVSSAVVEFNPFTPYGIEKEMGERYCFYYQKQFGLDVSVIRLQSVYGSPRHSPVSGNVIPSFIEQKKKTGKLQVSGDGSQFRDFVYYTDIVAAILEAEKRQGLTQIGTCEGH